ncbi:type I restriction-modification system subunit M (plasmid) [Streptomyces sp. BHT-5-2]|uniref:class I SAM-dependent DNA methyltransferase n=1 Tax=Streptomyces sp. BHT-5-2 TaxID=2866715 RepID=UPI001C8ED064|nr:N-6 DNA methylase [Streptomyces sp. BHT-5-2]QZL08764.1 type I restriction-modification system subunit M [Streptomyces sp. BHT-5-2]
MERLWKFYNETAIKAVPRLDFVEHVTYLLFLKLDHERAQRPARFGGGRPIASADTWPKLAQRSGEELHRFLTDVMDDLGKPAPADPRRATASVIFHDAQPWNVDRMAELRSLITEELDPHQWSLVPQPVLGGAFSQLLAGCREDFLTKRQAGQILTPPPLLSVVARALAITPEDRVVDPASGIGSSLIAAHREMSRHGRYIDAATIAGADIDAQMCRLATMNVLLNLGRVFSADPPFLRADSLKERAVAIQRADRDVLASVAICNPPFKSTDALPDTTRRDDFWAHKADLPTNFLQHIAITLPQGARAAVFVPDGVLYGNGAAAAVRRTLLMSCDVHTLLRLPTGIFHGTNSRSNVLFFTKSTSKPTGEPATHTLWVYDARTDKHHTDTENPMSEDDFADFLAAYRVGEPCFEGRTASARFRPYPVDELLARPGTDLHLGANLTAELDDFGSPQDIALSIADNLDEAGKWFRTVAESLT